LRGSSGCLVVPAAAAAWPRAESSCEVLHVQPNAALAVPADVDDDRADPQGVDSTQMHHPTSGSARSTPVRRARSLRTAIPRSGQRPIAATMPFYAAMTRSRRCRPRERGARRREGRASGSCAPGLHPSWLTAIPECHRRGDETPEMAALGVFGKPCSPSNSGLDRGLSRGAGTTDD
jgi:hypothetical protein